MGRERVSERKISVSLWFGMGTSVYFFPGEDAKVWQVTSGEFLAIGVVGFGVHSVDAFPWQVKRVRGEKILYRDGENRDLLPGETVYLTNTQARRTFRKAAQGGNKKTESDYEQSNLF